MCNKADNLRGKRKTWLYFEMTCCYCFAWVAWQNLMTESNKGSFLTLNVLLHIYNTTELLDSVEKKITLFYGGLKKGKMRQKVALLLTCQTPSVMFCHLPDSGRQVTSIFQGLSLSNQVSPSIEGLFFIVTFFQMKYYRSFWTLKACRDHGKLT